MNQALEDNNALVLLAIGVILLMCWQNFFGNKMVMPPETLAPNPQDEEYSHEEEMNGNGNGMAMANEQMVMGNGPAPNGSPEEGTTRAYGDFDGPQGPVYFKPHGSMGDAASSPNGVLAGSAGSCHPIDKCNRFYCFGCGQCNPGGKYTDSDDIRRDYNGMITQMREQSGAPYPFYKLS